MMQQQTQDEHARFSDEKRSMRELIELAFANLAAHSAAGNGCAEGGIAPASGAILVRIDRRYVERAESDMLLGDGAKAVRVRG
jgi:GDP-D-mannose dehydratase